jgi:hypothetical protein
VTLAGEGVFVGSGAIGQYWQARCLGFEVRCPNGRLLGVVVGVEYEHDSGRTAVLLVRRRRRGRRTRLLRVAPAWVTIVDPWRRLVVVALPRKDPWTRHARAASQAAVRGGRRARERAAGLGLASWGAITRAWRVARVVRRFAFWLGARMIYAVAFACWLYGMAVFVLFRAIVRLLLVAGTLLYRLGLLLRPLLRRASETTRRAAHRAAAALASQYMSRAHHSQRRRSRSLSEALGSVRPFASRHERLLGWTIVAAALALLSWGIADRDAAGIAVGALLILMALRILVHVGLGEHSAEHSRTIPLYWKR